MPKFETSEDLRIWVAEQLSDPKTNNKFRITPKEQTFQNELMEAVEKLQQFRTNPSGNEDVIVNDTINSLNKYINGYKDKFITDAKRWRNDELKIHEYLVKNRDRIEYFIKILFENDESYRSLWNMADQTQDIIRDIDENKNLTLVRAAKKLSELEGVIGKKVYINIDNVKKSVKDLKSTIKYIEDPDFAHKSIIFAILIAVMESLNLPVLFAEGPARSGWIVPAYLEWLRITNWKHIYSLKGANTTGKRLIDTQSEQSDEIRREMGLRTLALSETTKRIAGLPDIPRVPELIDDSKDGKETKQK